MTPFELKLHNDLDVERQRFGSEWTFQWHKLRMEGKVVDVDRFDGGRIYLGGIEFGYQQQCIFWQAIGRYLKGKVHETFGKWDVDTKHYPPEARKSSLEGTGRELWVFVAGVSQYALKTEQALRGKNGVPAKEKSMESSGTHAGANAEIVRLLEAHKKLLPVEPAAVGVESKPLSRTARLEKWYSEHKALTWLIGIVITAVGIAAKMFL
jgi:hypothetical protein